ncbi:uncharacterized protein PHALS_09170 [Plasmopara halstedii]|uniref:Uncharacterized protein n=1 Tax=Plasmopara halstedii TaxID=4781 RepID=A0A0P1AEX5_PLAHL|nr:uncharacterized protein PHALS_09170 [Plasmopara halstedii]CEG39112.1 hypothetical protein PHALS_09170 [Plasmopara halstedii]|eukprot:XP_024575481.1 hypothetical protein PHALS_09170 [Plasmopara halstedii]
MSSKVHPVTDQSQEPMTLTRNLNSEVSVGPWVPVTWNGDVRESRKRHTQYAIPQELNVIFIASRKKQSHYACDTGRASSQYSITIDGNGAATAPVDGPTYDTNHIIATMRRKYQLLLPILR